MTIGLVGRKAGMTRVFTEAGDSVPVTVIEVDPNRVTQVKTADTDGYAAIQITVGERRALCSPLLLFVVAVAIACRCCTQDDKNTDRAIGVSALSRFWAAEEPY